MEKDKTNLQMRNISQIAKEILADWKNPYYGAKPYIQAMLNLNSVDDKYGVEPAMNILNGFLANASTWRGEKARQIKNELKQLLKH